MNDTVVHGLDEFWPLLQSREKLGRPARIGRVDGRPLDTGLVEDWSGMLRAAGLGHGDRLLVLAEPDPATLAVFVAAWTLGVAVCPLPPETSAGVLTRIAADCGARQAVSALRAEWTRFDHPHLPDRPGSRLEFRTPRRVTGVDLALLIYTSGSTGNPKGIMLSHSNVLAALRAIVAYLALSADDVILSVPPLHFDYGLYQALFGLFTGCRVVLTPPSTNPMKALQYIRDVQPTVLPVVPALGAGIAKLGLALKQTHRSVRLITNTGGHLPAPVIEDLRRVFPQAAVMPMYGLSESKRALYLVPELVDARPGSVGRPMPGLDAKVMVPDGIQTDGTPRTWREAEPHEVGMLFVRGASVMQGYTEGGVGAGAQLLGGAYRDDNWLLTGDLFSADADGFLYFRGRAKELIKQGGFCLYPRDIEALVERHPGVLECVVVGVTTANADEMACLFVHGREALTREGLLEWLGRQLDPHYLPRRIDIVDAWPMNQNGKIDRKALGRRIEAELAGTEG